MANCLNCQKEYKQDRKDRKFCSTQCATKYNRHKFMFTFGRKSKPAGDM